MRKVMKKTLSILLVMIITLSIAPAGVFTANAADIDYLTYKIENGEATITDCDETATGEITIPNEIEGAKVTNIDYKAFYDCADIISVVIPDTVDTLGAYAFTNSGITEIEIPEGISTIKSQTFYGCKNLESVHLPESLTEIQNSAFNGCSSLVEVILPSGLEKIGDQAFMSCTKLTTVNLPETLISIGMMTFHSCKSLLNIVIPNGITEISDFLFYGCSSLQNVTIPYSVTSIGNSAFYNCVDLGVVSLPSELKTIGNSAFESRTLKLPFPDSLVSVGNACFKNAKFVDADGNRVIDIELPENLTTIGEKAFYNTTIRMLNIPASVESIGNNAFQQCGSIKSISVDASNNFYTSDENGVLYNKAMTELIRTPSLTEEVEFIIPDTVEKICDWAFFCCDYSLVYISKNVKEFGIDSFALSSNAAFEVDKENQHFTIDENGAICDRKLTRLYKYPKISELRTIHLSDSIEVIEDYAFDGAENIAEVVFGKNLREIGEQAFRECNELVLVTFHKGIESIGSYAFYSCELLNDVFYYGSEEEWDKITISANNNSLLAAEIHFDYTPITGSCGDSARWNYYEDTKTLAIVGGGAMYDFDSPEDCEWCALKDDIELVTVSGKVESVGANVFNGYPNLKEVYFANSTQTVGENAFANCPNLSLVSSTASTLNIGENAFDGCNDRIKFVCYSANDGMLEFASEKDLIKVSFDPEQKALKFNGGLTVYPDLNYEFLNRFLMNNNGAEYVFFSKLIFHGVEPDIVDVGALENDATAQYLTFTNLYISLRAVKNGEQKNITFGEMLELLEDGDYDAFIFDLNSDESNQEVTVPSWKKTIENFIEDVVKAVSKLINFVAKLFKRK